MKASTGFLADMQAPNLAEGQTEVPPTTYSVPEQSDMISIRKPFAKIRSSS
jgi:hypothetical protein